MRICDYQIRDWADLQDKNLPTDLPPERRDRGA